MTSLEIWSLLVLVTGCCTGAIFVLLLELVWGWVDDLRRNRNEASAEMVEAELDRKQSEVRRAILRLADALAEENVQADRAKAEMIRAAYLVNGQLP